MKTRQCVLATLLVLLILVAACGGDGKDVKPSLNILSPPNQHTITLGEQVKFESRAKDDRGISQVELRINDVQEDVFEIPKGEKSFIVQQNWLPKEEGIYYATVIAYDNDGNASDPAAITIFVNPGPAVTVMPLPSPLPSPLPTSPPALTATPAQASPQPGSCSYSATFVADVTITDNTRLEPGTEFVKTWRLRNTSTCDWGAGFQFIFVGGEQMRGPASVSVLPTPRGASVDVSVRLWAPDKPGTYRGTWRMRTPDGREFGQRPYVQIAVVPPATATPIPTHTATPTPKPDLDITLVSGDLELLVNQPLELRVTVRNHGPGVTDQPALVRAVMREDLAVEATAPTLAAGGQAEVLMTYAFNEPVDLEVSITVDPVNEIIEEDETNNTEKVPVIVNPPLYVTGTVTATVGLSFDWDDAVTETEKLDFEWRVVEGTVYLSLLNDAAAAPLGEEVESPSYALVAGLTWETEQLALPDLAAGKRFGFRTSDGRVGYARIEEVLDTTRTSALVLYRVWDWP